MDQVEILVVKVGNPHVDKLSVVLAERVHAE